MSLQLTCSVKRLQQQKILPSKHYFVKKDLIFGVEYEVWTIG